MTIMTHAFSRLTFVRLFFTNLLCIDSYTPHRTPTLHLHSYGPVRLAASQKLSFKGKRARHIRCDMAGSTNYIYSNHLYCKDGFLFCDQIKVKDLQKALTKQLNQASPFYLFSAGQIRENIRSYKSELDRCKMRYLLGFSLKANYNPWICKMMVEEGCTVVAVSGNEIKLGLKAGATPENIIFNGNGKHAWEIDLAVENDCFINADSEFDIRHISDSAKRLNKTAKVLFRVNPDIDSKVHPYLATGLAASKFGLQETNLYRILDVIKSNHLLNLVGLHCHLGSTIDNINVFRESLDALLNITENVRQTGINSIQYINLGGGLGIDHHKHTERTRKPDEDPTEKKTMPEGSDLVAEVRKRLADRDLHLILEPGRSLIGSAGTLITTVFGCKQNAQAQYIVVDGAMTEAIRPALYGAYHHIELIEPSQLTGPDAGQALFDVVGPVCECADFLGKARWFTRPHEGCGMAVFDAGAYCGSMGSNYNLRMRPADVLVDGDKWQIIRYPDSFQDLMKCYPEKLEPDSLVSDVK